MNQRNSHLLQKVIGLGLGFVPKTTTTKKTRYKKKKKKKHQSLSNYK